MLAIHSLLEFPLWYAYFLGVAALTLGIFDTTTYHFKPCGAGRWPAVVILLSGLLSLSQMLYLYGYGNFEVSMSVLNSATKDSNAQRIRTQRVYKHMLAVQQGRTLLLRPYVEYILGQTGWDHIADKGVLNERVMWYIPGSPVVYRQALLLARFNRQADARVQIERAIWAYPDAFPEFRDKLRAMAGNDTDPSRYPALLEFALQKYEERQRTAKAGHTR